MSDPISTWVVLTQSMTFVDHAKDYKTRHFQRILCRRSNAPIGLRERTFIDIGDGHCGYPIDETYWHENLNALVYYVHDDIHSEMYRDDHRYSTIEDHKDRFERFTANRLRNGWQLGDVHDVLKPGEKPAGFVPGRWVTSEPLPPLS